MPSGVRSRSGQEPFSGRGQRSSSSGHRAGQRSSSSGRCAGQRPQTTTTISSSSFSSSSSSASSGHRPATSASSGHRPPTTSASSGHRPPTTSASSGHRPPTTSASSGHRPPTTSASSSSGHRPPTTSASSSSGHRPPTTSASSSSGHRPPTTSASSSSGHRPPTTSASSSSGHRPPTTSASSSSGHRPPTTSASSSSGQRPPTTSASSSSGQRPHTLASSSSSPCPQTSSSSSQRPPTTSACSDQHPQTSISSSSSGQRPQTSISSSSSSGHRPPTTSASSSSGQRPPTTSASSSSGQHPHTSASSSSSQCPQTTSASSSSGQCPPTTSASSSSSPCPPTTSASSSSSQCPPTTSASSSSSQCPQTSSSSGQRPPTTSACSDQHPQTSISSSSGQRPQTSISSSSFSGQCPQTSSSSGQCPQTSLSFDQRLQTLPPSGRRPQTSSFGTSCHPCLSRVSHAAHHKLHSVNWEGKHLWLYLRALDFDPKTASSGVRLGPMMFEKPNASAFFVIARFLFVKLDKLRAAEVFGDCSLPVEILKTTEFRKKCCSWLREIANKDPSQLPKFAPSALFSPGGPKFIHLMYCFARHTVLEDMKRNSIGTDIPFAEAVKLAPRDINMASARCRVASKKLLQILQKENLVIEEYKKKKKLLIKEIKEIKSEYKALQLKSFKMKQNDRNDKIERIQKVRGMWTGIMEIITSLAKEKEAVDYVLQDCVGQYVLDGASVVPRIPQLLSHRIENDVHQSWSGNVYEAGKLNFLMIIQLLNEALRTLRDEISQSELTPQLAYIKDINVKCIQALQNLESMRLNLKQQHYGSRSESISREQEDWEVKWKNFLGQCPFNLMLEQNPQLALLRALPPHYFRPSKDDDDDSMFYQHLLLNSDIGKTFHEVCNEKTSDASSAMDMATTASRWISSVPLDLSKACENRDALTEKNLPIEACKREKMPVPVEIFKKGKDDSAISEASENTDDLIAQTESPVKKEDPFKKCSDELAEEIARTVASESPQSDENKGMALEDILSSLAFDPFLTRKQIPRTPENLVTEIRSSWRKAVQPDDSDIELPSAKAMKEVPVDSRPIIEVVADSRLMGSTPTSPIADSDPSLSERKPLLHSSEVKSQKEMRISHVIESPLLEISGMRETERTGEQELRCIGDISVQSVNCGKDPEESSACVKRSMNTLGHCLKDKSIIDVLSSVNFQDSSMDRMHQNASPLLSSVSCKASISWILDETFPEELDSMNTTAFASSDSDVAITDITDDSKNKGDIQESKLDLQSPLNPCKVLKTTASPSKEELHQAHSGGKSVSCTSDKNLKPGKRDELFSPLVFFTLDEAFTKTPSPTPPYERKEYLSSLLSSCQRVEEMVSMAHDLPLNLITKLKEKELLKEEPGTKEPSSG